MIFDTLLLLATAKTCHLFHLIPSDESILLDASRGISWHSERHPARPKGQTLHFDWCSSPGTHRPSQSIAFAGTCQRIPMPGLGKPFGMRFSPGGSEQQRHDVLQGMPARIPARILKGGGQLRTLALITDIDLAPFACLGRDF
jgi:hypothetical protein